MKIASLITIYQDANGLCRNMHALALLHVAGIKKILQSRGTPIISYT